MSASIDIETDAIIQRRVRENLGDVRLTVLSRVAICQQHFQLHDSFPTGLTAL